jgi:hypothetical protein
MPPHRTRNSVSPLYKENKNTLKLSDTN